MVLICISLVSNDVEHLFMCLSFLYLLWWNSSFYIFFGLFSNCIVWLSLLVFKVHCIFWKLVLCWTCGLQILSLFILIRAFWKSEVSNVKIRILTKSNDQFYLDGSCFLFVSSLWPALDSRIFSIFFLSFIFYIFSIFFLKILSFTFKPVNHFELIFYMVWGLSRGSLFLPIHAQMLQHHLKRLSSVH